MNDNTERDPRFYAIPDTHGHAKGEHKPYAEERPLPLTARMLFLWFYHACRRGYPRFLMVADHMNYLTFEDPAAVNLVRRALKLAQAGDLYGAAETANVDVGHAAAVSEGLRRGMRYSIGAEVDNDPRSRPDAQNIVDAMRPDAIIRSVHFVPITHPVHGENWPWPFDNPEFADLFDVVGTETLWETYITTLVDAIERLPGHIVGHFYVPAVFGHWPDDAKLETYEDRVLEAAAARGMAIEFNTRFLYRDHTDEEKQRYLAANKRLLRKAKERGVGIAIGSDAHSPKDQGNGFETVLAVLDELEINEIIFPLGGLLRRVALRVVREPDPEPPPPPPEPVKVTVRADEAEPAAEAPKPVRKARPAPKPARAAERPEPAAVDGPPAAPPIEEPAPKGAAAAVTPAPARPPRSQPPKQPPKRPPNGEAVAARVDESAPAPDRDAAPDAPAAAPAAAADPVVAPASDQPTPPPKGAKPPAVKAEPPAKPQPPSQPAAAKATAVPAKPPVKAVPAKTAAKAPAKKASAAKQPAKAAPKAKPTGKNAHAKLPPKPVHKKAVNAKAPAKKAAPAKKSSTVKKAAPAKKSPPPKKTAARAPAKKAVPAKKPAAKKPASGRSAPPRKATAAKKTMKKTATKRR